MSEKTLTVQHRYDTENLFITFCTDGPKSNRLQEVTVNGKYPVNVEDVYADKKHKALRQFLDETIEFESSMYWVDQKVKGKEVACS